MAGGLGFVRFSGQGKAAETGSITTSDTSVPPGAVVEEILTTPYMESEPHPTAISDTATSRYTLQPNDRLILRPYTDLYTVDDGIGRALGIDKAGCLIHPAHLPLPFPGGVSHPTLRYEVAGVIRGDNSQLVSWESRFNPDGGTAARDLVDLMVISQSIENTLELALFERRVGRRAVLSAMLDVSPTVRAYLDDFAEGRYPVPELSELYERFGSLSSEQMDLYSILTARADGFEV